MNYCDQWREKRVVGGKETKHDAGGWKSQHPERQMRGTELP